MGSKSIYLGIDLGTSTIKGLAMAALGTGLIKPGQGGRTLSG